MEITLASINFTDVNEFSVLFSIWIFFVCEWFIFLDRTKKYIECLMIADA